MVTYTNPCNNKSEFDDKMMLPEDVDVERITRSHYIPKVKSKLLKDTKSTSKKRPRSASQEPKTKINLFPDVILPFKKRPIDVELCNKKEETNLTKINVAAKKSKTPKQSSSKKNVWTEYMNINKPKRILMEVDGNRKFFKSKVIHSDIPNKKKDNGFNFKVINWNDKNRNSSTVEIKQSNPELLDDTKVDHISQDSNKLVEFFDDDGHLKAIHCPFQSPLFKRSHEDSKSINKDDLNHNSVLSPVSNNSAYNFNEDYDGEKSSLSAYSSPAANLKDVSNYSIDFNSLAINESVDTSVIMKETPQKNLFPIFMNVTPSPSRIIPFTEKKSTGRKERRIIDHTQYQIDAGQKKFGGFLCKPCGLYYSRGEPEDEAEHDKYHEAKDIFKYKSFKNEKVIFRDVDERIVVISGSDTKIMCSKALEVMSFVDKELGCYTQHSVLPATKKVYLYIQKKQVIGCLVIDLISRAYRNLETGKEDIVVVSEESYAAKAGVNSVWTKWDCRKTGIATKMLDYFRKNYVFGHILGIDEIAFTVPTRAGQQFIKKYTKKNNFLVYTGW